MVYAFISYSSKDAEFASKMEADLNEQGIQTWRDRTRLRGDHYWDVEIEKALGDPTLSHLLVLLSEFSVKSEMVRNEIEYGRGEGKTLVAILLRDCKIPLLLIRKQRIDFRRDYVRGLSELLYYAAIIQCPDETCHSKPPSEKSTYKLTGQQIEASHDERNKIRLIACTRYWQVVSDRRACSLVAKQSSESRWHCCGFFYTRCEQ